jgi:hypothetical protein
LWQSVMSMRHQSNSHSTSTKCDDQFASSRYSWLARTVAFSKFASSILLRKIQTEKNVIEKTRQ